MDMQFRVGNDVKCRLKLSPGGSPEPPGPAIDWDETKIGVMRLTEDKEPTDEIEYFMTWREAADYCWDSSETNMKWWIHQGILMDPVPLLGDSQFAGIPFTYIDIYHQPEIPDYCFDGYYGYYFDRITGLEGVTRFGDRAFGDQHYLEQFDIPSTVRELGYSALSGLTFTSIVIPEGVTEIADELFYLDPYLTSVTLPSTITTIGARAFWRCYALPSITIPSSVTSIEEEAFIECNSLTSIIVNKPAGSISGAPWGAEHATVTWGG